MTNGPPKPDDPITAAAVRAWCELDRRRAAWPGDTEIIDASTSLRALVVERARARATDPTEDELFDACAVLGRRIARAGGSVTLAAWTIDHAGEVLGTAGAEWLRPAAAAVAEGYVAEALEGARHDALAAWDFPGCIVPLGGAAIAIAASLPSDDAEAVAGWAARIAQAAAVRGVRKAFVAGAHSAAIVEALAIAGIRTVVT
jgi:hypothetical protein